MAAEAQALSDADFAPSPTSTAPVDKSPVLSDADFGSSGAAAVSQPPVPQGTTLLSDKNVVVGHPMDMSHDQVNDAIQTQMYGRPRNNFHDDATPLESAALNALKTSIFGLPFHVAEATPPTASDVKSVAPETGKAAVRGIENIGKGVAGLAKWVGEVMQNPGVDAEGKSLPVDKDLVNKMVQHAGKGLADLSQSATDYLNHRQQAGFEAPNPDIFRGSFVSNPSFSRLAANVAEGAPTLAAATALTLATGNPLAGAGALGLVGAGEQYTASREQGSSVLRGSIAAAASGIGNTLLMSLPLGKALEGFGPTAAESALKGAAEFTGITAAMTPFNNIVAKIGGDKSRRLFDGMTESLLSAAVSGGILGGFTPGRGAEIDALIQDAHKAGVPAKDIDAARSEIAKQMVENPEAVTGAIKESKVYTDIKTQLSDIEKPASMTPEQWQQNIEAGSQLWAARVASEARKRGETVDQAYARMRPTIVGEEVGAPVETPSGEKAVVSHAAIIDEAQRLYEDALTKRGPAGDLEKFVQDNGGFRANQGEAEEHAAVPLRFKGPNHTADEMAQMAFDRGLISEPSGDALREELKAIPKRGAMPRFADFVDEAQRNLSEQYAQREPTPEDAGTYFQKPQPEIPTFKGSTDAIKFGVDNLGRQDVIDTLKSKMDESTTNFENAMAGDDSKAISKHAFERQFYREALEAAQGKLTEKGYTGKPETLFQRDAEAPALEEKALKTFGETDNIDKAGFILPDGKMVDFTHGGDRKIFMHQDISEIFKGTGRIDDPSSLLREFMGKTGAVRLSDYDEVNGKHMSVESPGPLSEEQLRNIGEYLESGKASSVTFEVVDAIGRPVRAKSFIEPTGADLARFFNGSSTYFQGKDLGGSESAPRGATSFTPEKTIIKLFKNADASTFVHESAHAWLQDIHDFVKSGKADEKYMADWKKVGDWLGVKEGAKRLTTEQHEKFARGFESYLREGVAPAPPLQLAFDKFKDWLSKIYRSAQDLKVEIPSEVKGVMDDMVRAETPDTANNKYVKNRTFDVALGPTDKTTSRTLREEFSGIKNEQIVRGNQLSAEIKRAVPSKEERQGMFWYKAAQGDMNVLADALSDPRLKDYHDQITAAMNLSPKAVEALQKVGQYYDEAGRVSQEIGTIKSIRENYQNRIYEPEKPQDFVKTETKSGIKQSTKHALRRVFDTEFEAAQAGKKFATTDVADALSIHNEELARVNTSRKMADAMSDSGLGAWKREAPDGWEQVGTLEKRVPIKDKEGNAVIGEDGNQAVSRSLFVAPKGIAKGLAAIADPNFAKKIDSVRNLQRYQGLVKTVDLSFSFFHHFSMAMQSLYQGGFRALMHLPTMEEHLNTPEFDALEQDFTKHTGMTAKVEANQDILRNLVQHNEDYFSKVSNLPGVKNILEGAQKSSEFLFGKMQRFLKVSDYGEKISNWVAGHPDATNAEVREAKLGFAKQINSVYGGLNWEALGMTKSNLSLLRLGLLAPDWTISNIQLLQYALGDSGTAGKASRAHVLTALVSGMALTEGMNKLLTGHFTDENKKGHELEVEIAPDVYVSFLRGGIGDITKFASMVRESGLQGVARFTQGKLAPFPRTAVGLLTNTQYTGRAISHKARGPVGNTYDVMKFLLSSLVPVPLGVSNFLQMIKDEKITPQGAAAVLTGVGRYSKSGSNSAKLKM